LYNLSGQKALVTGGTGFLGSHLAQSLRQSGAEVHLVSRTNRYAQEPSIKWWQGDLTNIESVRKLLTSIRPELVFHLCSHSVGSPDLQNVLPTFHNDLLTTVNVLTVATEIKVRRLIIAASLEEPQPTDTKIIPSTPYAAAKWAGSAYAQMFHLLYQTPVVMVRPFMTYGPRQPNHKLIPYLILSLLKGDPPKLSSGTRPVDWIYVNDVIDGMLAAVFAPGIESETIDLGSGTLVPIKSVVQKITQLVNNNVEPLLGALPDRPQERVRVADVESAYSKLNWKPTTTLDDGLKRTVDWYREQFEALGKK
jgi:UDP-glucose 4-epimerase